MGLPRVGVVALNADTVGAVRSMVTVVPVAPVAGPVLPAASVTVATPSVGTTVPSVGPVLATCTVKVVPLDADTLDTVQPAELPPSVKSLTARPFTGSLKVRV